MLRYFLILCTLFGFLSISSANDGSSLPQADELTITFKGKPQAIQVRNATLEEIFLLLQSDESDEPEQNINRYWKETPAAYYRWDLQSDGELGLITDIAKETFMASLDGGLPPEALPRVVTTEIDGKERIIAFGATYGGDVKFHVDSQLRRGGYKGIGTAIVFDYIRWCYLNGYNAELESVNGSYPFYEKLGFEYNTFDTPDKVTNPSEARFAMVVIKENIPAVLERLLAKNR